MTTVLATFKHAAEHDCQEKTPHASIHADMLDALFTFQEWSDQQIADGVALRQAGRAYASAFIAQNDAAQAFHDALSERMPTMPIDPDDTSLQARLQRHAAFLGQDAIARAEGHISAQQTRVITDIADIIMQANTAITFDAAGRESA